MPTRSRASVRRRRLRVPDREREHPAQIAHAVGAVLLEVVDDRLGVAAGLEAVALPLQRRPQRREVVDLAVERDDDRAVLVLHRLVAGDEIDDRQPAVAERDLLRGPVGVAAAFAAPFTRAVGTAVRDLRQHAPEPARLRRPVDVDEARDAAHRLAPSPARPAGTRSATRSSRRSCPAIRSRCARSARPGSRCRSTACPSARR